LKLSNETLSKQAEKERKNKKEVHHMIPNFQAQKATTTNHTQQQQINKPQLQRFDYEIHPSIS
jgi:hypothetical protein